MRDGGLARRCMLYLSGLDFAGMKNDGALPTFRCGKSLPLNLNYIYVLGSLTSHLVHVLISDRPLFTDLVRNPRLANSNAQNAQLTNHEPTFHGASFIGRKATGYTICYCSFTMGTIS